MVQSDNFVKPGKPLPWLALTIVIMIISTGLLQAQVYVGDLPLPNQTEEAKGMIGSSKNLNFTIDNYSTREGRLDKTLQIYPNPTQGKLKVRVFSEQTAEMELRLLHPNGSLIQSWVFIVPAGMSTLGLNLLDLPEGIYYLQGRLGEEWQTLMVIRI